MTAYRFSWEADPLPASAPGVMLVPAPKRRGQRPALPPAVDASAAPTWLYHHLTVIGPAAALAVFAAAVRGSGVIPWRIDSVALVEDVFNLAASKPPARRRLDVAGCRILARQFRDRVEARQSRRAGWAQPRLPI